MNEGMEEATGIPGEFGSPHDKRGGRASTLLDAGQDVVAGAGTVAELEHADGSRTRLDAGASGVLRLPVTVGELTQVGVRLGPGRSWHRHRPSKSPTSYVAGTPAATITARGATFTVESGRDGSCRALVLVGEVLVRSRRGSTVSVAAGETVAVAGDGVIGAVRGLTDADVDGDEWVAVNRLLDEEEPAEEDRGVALGAGLTSPAEAAPTDGTETADAGGRWAAEAGAAVARPSSDQPDDGEVMGAFGGFGDGAHEAKPWRVGTIGALALVAALMSVVLTRDDGQRSSAPRRNADVPDGLVVSGPPAFSAPAVTAPRVPVETPDAPPRFIPGQPRPTTTVPAIPRTTTTISFFAEAPPPLRDPLSPTSTTAPAPRYRVTSTGCRRGASSITYTGTIANDSEEPVRYLVSIRIDDGNGALLDSKRVTTKAVQPGGSSALRAEFNGAKVRSAASCDVSGVELLPPG